MRKHIQTKKKFVAKSVEEIVNLFEFEVVNDTLEPTPLSNSLSEKIISNIAVANKSMLIPSTLVFLYVDKIASGSLNQSAFK